jgi:hypothetical protein
MPSLAEIWRTLHGAWRLLLLDTRGLGQFDGSRTGGLRSFWAIACVLPLNIAMTVIEEIGPTEQVLPPHSAVLQLVGGMLAWPLLLLIMFGLAGWYGRAERFWLFVSTYNWIQIPLALAGLLIVVLFTAAGSLVDLSAPGSASGAAALVAGAAVLLALALRVAIYAYEGYVAWISLDAGIALPIIVVLLDVVSGLALDKLSIALA